MMLNKGEGSPGLHHACCWAVGAKGPRHEVALEAEGKSNSRLPWLLCFLPGASPVPPSFPTYNALPTSPVASRSFNSREFCIFQEEGGRHELVNKSRIYP